MSSKRAGIIEDMLRRDQAVNVPVLTPMERCPIDEMDMDAVIELPLDISNPERPTVRCKIKLTNKSWRDVKLPVSVLPRYTFILGANLILGDGSVEKLHGRSFKPRPMNFFESSILAVGESRDYTVDLSMFKFHYGHTYEVNLQFKTRIGYSGILYNYRSNAQSLMITFDDPSGNPRCFEGVLGER